MQINHLEITVRTKMTNENGTHLEERVESEVEKKGVCCETWIIQA